MKGGRAGLALVLARWTAGGAAGALAQPPARVPRIGYLSSDPTNLNFQTFCQGPRDLGWIEGQNVVIERPSADGRVERLPALAAELVRGKVDVIFATALAVPAARSATRTMPIVFTTAEDPVAAGYVTSLARPAAT
jgi:putative ABC transport system substrate-binding protein